LIDLPRIAIDPKELPEPPAGKRIARVEVVIRLRDAES
jgi:Fur family iron response transcriptional regulator